MLVKCNEIIERCHSWVYIDKKAYGYFIYKCSNCGKIMLGGHGDFD